MAGDDISRRALAACPRHRPAPPGLTIPVAEGHMERRLLLLLGAVSILSLGGCDFGGSEDEDDKGEEGEDDD